MSEAHVEDIRRYYDRHTPAFVSLGPRGSGGAIHRAVWAPGVRSRREAFRYVDDQILALVAAWPPQTDPPHLVDLGCGVGASLCHLATRLPVRATGITVSPVQARLARDRIARAGLADRVRCVEGDFCAPDVAVAEADLAYAIESFVHAPSAGRFFAQCRRLIRPGGWLVICDDVLRPSADPAAAAAVARFRDGWRIGTLLDRDGLIAAAHDAGFAHQSTLDLSPYLELRRPRDRAAALLVALGDLIGRRPAWLGYLAGGHALQTCLARGWIGYDLARFQRVA